MKLVIVVYGNVASGKSTVTKLLLEKLTNYKLVNLDKCRVDAWQRNLGNGPGHRDTLAQEMCLKEMTGDKLIYETTAVTNFYKRAATHLRRQGYAFVFVRLECSSQTCYSRFVSRKQDGHVQAPFAYGGKKDDIRQAIAYFADEQQYFPADLRFNTENKPSSEIVQTIYQYLTGPAQ